MKKILLLSTMVMSGTLLAQEVNETCTIYFKKFFDPASSISTFSACLQEDDVPVGMIIYHIPSVKKDIATVHYLNVDEEFRKQGIGSQLFTRTMDDMKNHGCKQAQWTVAPFDSSESIEKQLNATIHFYQKNGAELVTQSPHPEHNSKQPLMIKRLNK